MARITSPISIDRLQVEILCSLGSYQRHKFICFYGAPGSANLTTSPSNTMWKLSNTTMIIFLSFHGRFFGLGIHKSNKRNSYSLVRLGEIQQLTTSFVSFMIWFPFFLDAPGGAKLISALSNTTVLRKSPLRLTCQADASPEAEFHLYFNNRLIMTNSLGIFNVTVMSDGTYTCVPVNKVGAGKNSSVSVTAVGELTFRLICSISKTGKSRTINK